jgi:hypothetical protein
MKARRNLAVNIRGCLGFRRERMLSGSERSLIIEKMPNS